MADRIVLTDELYLGMIEHARREAPAEAVGVLGGSREGEATKRIELTNLAFGDGFFVDPYSQFRAFKTLQEKELLPLAIYHSHPHGPPDPSGVDAYFALRLNLIQIIVSLRPKSAGPSMRAFRIRPERLQEIPLLRAT
ncbi:MAG TPA: M67 family metallopeptidase [Thermoanaerobaculia bacterium]|nr:M67 family metallopeptidase [Thermoanaerobaculia bacterium]